MHRCDRQDRVDRRSPDLDQAAIYRICPRLIRITRCVPCGPTPGRAQPLGGKPNHRSHTTGPRSLGARRPSTPRSCGVREKTKKRKKGRTCRRATPWTLERDQRQPRLAAVLARQPGLCRRQDYLLSAFDAQPPLPTHRSPWRDRDPPGEPWSRPARDQCRNPPIVDGGTITGPGAGRERQGHAVTFGAGAQSRRHGRCSRQDPRSITGRARDRRAGSWNHSQGVESRRCGRQR